MSELPEGFARHVADRNLDAAEASLQDAFPGRAPSSDAEADDAGRALVGFVAACCETGRADQAERIVDVLGTIRTRHIAYTEAYARAAFNVLTAYGEMGNVDSAAVYYERIITNSDTFHGPIALREAFRSGYGLATYMARQGRIGEASYILEEMIRRLDTTAEHATYGGLVAKAVFNVMTACGHVAGAESAENIYQYLRDLAHTFPQNSEVSECLANGLHNVIAFLTSDGLAQHAERRYAEIDALRRLRPDHTVIAASHGQCTVNIVALLSTQGQSERASAIAWAYADYAQSFGLADRRYTAKALYNLVPYLFAERRASDIRKVYKRLKELLQESGNDQEILRSVAAAEANLAVLTSAEGRFTEAEEWIRTISFRVQRAKHADILEQRADTVTSVAAYAAQAANDHVLDRLFTFATGLADQAGARGCDREIPFRVVIAVVDNFQNEAVQVGWLEWAVTQDVGAWNMRFARASEDVLQRTLALGAHTLTRRVVNVQKALDMTAFHERVPNREGTRGK